MGTRGLRCFAVVVHSGVIGAVISLPLRKRCFRYPHAKLQSEQEWERIITAMMEQSVFTSFVESVTRRKHGAWHSRAAHVVSQAVQRVLAAWSPSQLWRHRPSSSGSARGAFTALGSGRSIASDVYVAGSKGRLGGSNGGSANNSSSNSMYNNKVRPVDCDGDLPPTTSSVPASSRSTLEWSRADWFVVPQAAVPSPPPLIHTSLSTAAPLHRTDGSAVQGSDADLLGYLSDDSTVFEGLCDDGGSVATA